MPAIKIVVAVPTTKPILHTMFFSSKKEVKKYRQNNMDEMKKPVLNRIAVGPTPRALIGWPKKE